MYTKQLISPHKPPISPNNPKQNSFHGLFTSQALKTTSNFYSHKKLLKENDSPPSNSPTKGDHFVLENIKISNIKPNFAAYHTHNLSENHEEIIKKKTYDVAKTKSLKEDFSNIKNKEVSEESFNCIRVPQFEAKHKESSKNITMKESPKNQEENAKNEDFFIKNQDTGEVFYINDVSQVEKLQEPIKAEYLEKLKKRKKEEIWQEWWNDKKKKNQELLLAVKTNNIIQLSKLFDENKDDKKPEINSKDEKDWTCLHFACLTGNFDIVLLLIKLEAEIDPQSNLKQTPLIIAAQKGYDNIVSLLLASGSNVNHQDLSNNTALHYASIYGYKEVVKILLANPSINVNLINLENKTALEATSFQDIKKWIQMVNMKFKPNADATVLNKNNSLSSLRNNNSNNNNNNNLEKDCKYFSPEQKKRMLTKINEREKYDELIKPLFKINDRTLSNITCTSDFKFQSNSTSLSDNDSTMYFLNDLEKEKVNIQSFNLLTLIGKGSFGEVYLVQKKSSQEVFALKVLSKDKIISNNLVKYAITERNVLTFCNHPFIVKLHAAFQTFDRLFLVLTYCPGGDLAKYLSKEKRFAESKAKLYAAEILLALEHLHKKDIIYRDLKPDNVVLDSEGHALLTDFGLSREGVYDQIVAKSFCGSVAYLAPEMLKKQGHGKAVDWYLLGVLIYEMIIGIPPFYSENRHEIFENIDKGSLKFPNYVSKESKSLLMKLLERDPAKRLGSGPMEANEIKDHPFFKDLSWDEIINRKKSPGLPYLMKQYDKSHKFIDMELAFRDSEDSSKPKEDLQGWSFIEK